MKETLEEMNARHAREKLIFADPQPRRFQIREHDGDVYMLGKTNEATNLTTAETNKYYNLDGYTAYHPAAAGKLLARSPLDYYAGELVTAVLSYFISLELEEIESLQKGSDLCSLAQSMKQKIEEAKQ